MRKLINLIVALSLYLILITNLTAAKETNSNSLKAELKSAKDYNVQGIISFQEEDGKTKVTGTVKNISPGKHGFHVHENGDCSAEDFSSAGGHYNPTGHKHGAPEEAEHHIGDFGNIIADENGVAAIEITDSNLPLSGKNGIAGKAVVIHQDADDLISQPSGASGKRIACGVLKSATPAS